MWTRNACWAQAGPPQAGKRAETTLERWQQLHDLLGKDIGLLECAGRPDLALNTVKRYARAERPERLQRTPRLPWPQRTGEAVPPVDGPAAPGVRGGRACRVRG